MVSLTKSKPQLPSTAKLKVPILQDGRTYIPESPMQEEKFDVWFYHVLILYPNAGIVHGFTNPLP